MITINLEQTKHGKKKEKVLALAKTQKEKHRCIQAHEENRLNFQRTGKTTSKHKSAWKGNAQQYGNAPLSFCTEQSSTLQVTLSPPTAKQKEEKNQLFKQMHAAIVWYKFPLRTILG